MSIYIGDPDGLTWTEARQKVRGDLWRPGNSLPDDVVDRALHASVLDIEGETKWLWLEELTAVAELEDAADGIDLPATIGRVSAVAIRRAVGTDPLLAVPLATVRERLGGCGEPSSWAEGERRVWLDSRAPPGTAFELIVTFSTPRRLELALQSPSFTLATEQQAVIAGACAYVAAGFMKNAEEAARQTAVRDRIVGRLLDVEAERRGGMIQPDTWGMGHRG